jgi:hypothetical protein
MLNAPWLLVTTMLLGGAQSAPPSMLVVDHGLTMGNVTFASEDQGSGSSNGTAPHTFGFGAIVGAGALGTGLGLRGWFGNYVGIDMRLLLSRAELVGQTGFGGGGFSIEAAPSLIVMLTKPDDSREVDIRPYIGGGVNDTRAGTNATNTGSPVSGSGTQVFGGVEAAIRAAGGFAISVEVLYNKRSQTLVAAGVKSGVTGQFGFLFYVK